MAEFSIATATLAFDPGDVGAGGGASQEYCAQDVVITYTTEQLSFQCMDTVNPVTFAGLESWSGSCTLAYDDAGMDQLWGELGTLTFTVTTSTAATITISGTVLITEVASTFNNSELPQSSVTFVGSGALTEGIA